jgi:hypothetical protein|tara:strand:- start:251 stop:799 length:549 start_codon:yes stop_codon:yes gene_type:complete
MSKTTIATGGIADDAVTAAKVTGLGKVAQVLQTTKLDTFSTTSSSNTDVTGLSVAITPSSSSSKILITASISLGSDTADRNLNLFVTRGDTEIYKADQSGSNRQRAGGGLHYHHGLSSTVGTYSANIMFLDSPSSTSELTFKIRANAGANGGTLHINRTGDSTDDTNRASYPSSITVMEILS